ncbi:MAG TPA: hypothetical protein VIL48_12980 [Acidimicrobiales bacterium]
MRKHGGHRVHVEGARIIGSTVGGSVNAGVRVSVGSGPGLASSVEKLVAALQDAGLGGDPDLNRLVGRLEAVADTPGAEPGRVRRIVDQIEAHPALAQAIPQSVAAALQAIQLAIG